MRHFPFPYRFGSAGVTEVADYDEHIRDLIYQLLFTSPGERVNRPDFGSGLMQMVHAPNSDVLVGTAQMLIHGALHQYLGERIEVQDVDVDNEDSTLAISVTYLVKQTQQLETSVFRGPQP